MSARWAAGAVRARALARRRAGSDIARRVAGADGLGPALRLLADTTYGRRLHEDMELAAAEGEVERTLLWNLRVLAGWQPRPGVEILRVVACGFEAADVVGKLRELAGEPAKAPYGLGALATAWTGVRRAETPGQVREALSASPWGDPGGDDPAGVALFLGLSRALRLSRLEPPAARWAAGDAAVAVGREVHLARRRIDGAAARAAARLLGSAALRAPAWDEYVRSLPKVARWAVADLAAPEDLWRAEAAVRLRIEADSRELLSGGGLDARPVLGAAMLLSVDAWRVRAALECAARSGRAAEVFDAVA